MVDKNNASDGQIAIVGSAFRFPGGLNKKDQLWDFLQNRGNAITDIPEGRWQRDLYNPEVGRAGRTYVRRAGLLDDIELFDANFFGISPKEASRIDPQHRFLLETTYEALENGGIPLGDLRGSDTAVYVGISGNEYATFQHNDVLSINAYTNVGAAMSIAANRISHAFDLHGPSIAVDTACSSGLVAFDLACQALRDERVSAAIVASANILFRSETFVGFCQAGMLSPTAQCRAFDADADGFVRAEGVAAYVLKPLSRARADGDIIEGVVLASGSNSDGRTQGLSLPSLESQAALLEQVYQKAQLEPAQIDYIECHGTGTKAGDPIEATAIGKVIGVHRKTGSPLPIGSIKTNIGHTEPVSGLAGLAKVLLCHRNRTIPPSLHFQNPNPDIDFKGLSLKVATESIPLDVSDRPLIAGVNSFGFGGSNAHVVVQGYDNESDSKRTRYVNGYRFPGNWLMVSGASEIAAKDNARNLAAYIPENLNAQAGNSAANLDDICATLLTRRSWHKHRIAVWGADGPEIANALEDAANGDLQSAVEADAVPAGGLAFVFTGNGSQWWQMGRSLLESNGIFRSHVEMIDSIFSDLAGFSLVEELLRDESDSRMDRTFIAQPALFALQLALCECLADFGIKPDGVLGHSAGEIAASVASGALDLPEGARLAYERSRCQELTIDQGRMAAVDLSEENIRADLARYEGELVLAAVNTSSSVTVSGSEAAIDDLLEALKQREVRCTKLQIRYPFHSPAMDGIETDFRGAMGSVRNIQPNKDFYSTVLGEKVSGANLDTDYWWRNLRSPVLFNKAVNAMIADGYRVFVEIGPQPLLSNYLNAALREHRAEGAVIPTLSQLRNDHNSVLRTVASVAVNGGKIDPAASFGVGTNLESLPLYSWQREEHWHMPSSKAVDTIGNRGHSLLGEKLPLSQLIWANQVDLSLLDYLNDHVVRGNVLMPATGFIEMALAAGKEIFGTTDLEIVDIRFLEALSLSPNEPTDLQLAFDDHTSRFTIRSSRSSSQSQDWSIHATGHIRKCLRGTPADLELDSLDQQYGSPISADKIYPPLRQAGLEFGERFQSIRNIRIAPGQAFAELELSGLSSDHYTIHPCLLDAALQSIFGLTSDQDENKLFLPVEIGRVNIFSSSDAISGVARCTLVKSNSLSRTADIVLADSAGRVLVTFEEVQVWAVGGGLSVHSGVPFLRQVPKLVWSGDSDSKIDNTVLIPPEHYRSDAFAGWRTRVLDFLVTGDRICAAYSAAALLDLSESSPFTVQTLREKGVVDDQVQYLSTLIELAKGGGYLKKVEAGWIVSELPDLGEMWRRAFWQYPEYSADLTLAMRCGDNLVEVLCGRTDPLSLIFPSGDSVAEQFYECAAGFGAPLQMAGVALEKIVKQFPPDKLIRVLELGAGTGGTTSNLLSLFPKDRTRYVFSDVTEVFLNAAKARFSEYPFLETALVNIEETVEPESVGDPFDIIVASYVLHATTDIKQTLSNVHHLLKPGGKLVCLEIRTENIVNFIFGQIKGWWLFQDYELRKNSPLIPANEWCRLLADTGFNNIAAFGDMKEANKAISTLLIADKRIDALSVSSAESEAINDSPPIEPKIAGQASSNWLIIKSDRSSELADTLSADLATGRKTLYSICVSAEPRNCEQSTEGTWHLHTDDQEGWKKAIGFLKNCEIDNIVVFPDAGNTEKRPVDCFGMSLLLMLQSIDQTGWRTSPLLAIVTEEALHLAGSDYSVDPAQSAVWSLGRCISNEYPDMQTLRVDCHGGKALARRLSELLDRSRDVSADSAERDTPFVDEIILTPNAEYNPLLERYTPSMKDENPSHFALTTAGPGSINNLVVRGFVPRNPRPLEVQVAVQAVGLNFRDLMLALGVLPPTLLVDGPTGPCMGLEFSGIVKSVGADVTRMKPGDRVAGIFPGACATVLNVPVDVVARIPDRIGFSAAATLPIAGFTAKYSLEHLAHLKHGETVLIHSAVGGVGLAAIQIAKARGANVIATAGTEQKRELLKKLGADHVFDSRSLQFAANVLEVTSNRGVDVALNSLSGEAMLATLEVMAPYGRFLDIAKRDHLENRAIGMRLLEHNISHFSIDISTLASEKPNLMRQIFEDTINDLNSDSMSPLPYRVFPLERAREAFRYLQQARQVGKIIIAMGDPGVLLEPQLPNRLKIRERATYLITGGLGGLGLKIAQWLVEQGARHLVLIGRQGVNTQEQREAIVELESAGADIQIEAMDVSDENAVGALVSDISKRNSAPLKGIIHAAMTLSDQLITKMDPEKFRIPFRSKVTGLWNLHSATKDKTLDFFVCLSSATSAMGTAGQSNYIAANAFMESFMQYRRDCGLPGTAVCLGIVGEVGFVARTERLTEVLSEQFGVNPLRPSEAVRAMETLIQAGDNATLVLGQGSSLRSENIPIYNTYRFSNVLEQSDLGDGATSAAQRLNLEVIPVQERYGAVFQAVREAFAAVLSTKIEKIDKSAKLQDLGLDSLMAVELGMEIERRFGLKLSISKFVVDGTVSSMCDTLCDRLDVPIPDESSYATSDGQPSENNTKLEAKGRGGRQRQYVKTLNDGYGSAEKVLVAIPFLVANASVYAPLARHLAPHFDTLGLDLPGRHGHSEQTSFTSIESLCQTIGPEIISAVGNRSCLIYGHSAGGLYALELAHWLQSHSDLRLENLVLAASPPPSEFHPLAQRLIDAGINPKTAQFEDRPVKEWVSVLDFFVPDSWFADSKFAEFIVPATLNEINILNDYKVVDRQPLDCPVTLLIGDGDSMTGKGDVTHWKKIVGKDVKLHTVEGGHYFVVDNAKEVAKIIENAT